MTETTTDVAGSDGAVLRPGSHMEGHRPVDRTGGPPDVPPAQPGRGVHRPVAQGGERRREVDRVRQGDGAGEHRLRGPLTYARTLEGERPAWGDPCTSDGVRVRGPDGSRSCLAKLVSHLFGGVPRIELGDALDDEAGCEEANISQFIRSLVEPAAVVGLAVDFHDQWHLGIAEVDAPDALCSSDLDLTFQRVDSCRSGQRLDSSLEVAVWGPVAGSAILEQISHDLDPIAPPFGVVHERRLRVEAAP